MTHWTYLLRNALGALALVAIAAPAFAQVPVDDDGNAIGEWEASATDPGPAATGNEGIPLLSPVELQDLVGPVALYPDDLLAIVLPASTYPLQIVQAARFLEELESNPGLKPDENWDDSIIALLNYPEVIELLNEDLDWTWQLGEAVVAQQADVVAAVEGFRDTAYAAGNLQSDEYQEVSRDDGVIEITPVNDDIIYVPYYEPERVVVYQPRPVYHYYERPYPVYYYPYPDSYAFRRGFFWGVTTAFTIGWATDHLHVYHHSYHGHPYFGRHYYDRWWYRRPSINVHNTVYINNRVNLYSRRYSHGDYWQPSRNTRLRFSDQRITRNTHYPSRARRGDERRSRNYVTRNNANRNNANRNNSNGTYRFRDRSDELARDRSRDRSARSNSERKPPRTGPVAREPIARRDERREPGTRRPATRQPSTRQPTTRQPTTRQPLAGERSAKLPVVVPTPPTDRRRGDAPRSQPRSAPIRQARSERRNQPQPQARSERRSEPQRPARSERRSQPQQQARNERRSQPQRSERRSQPQQQARSERRSQPQRSERRSEPQRQARNEQRSESRRGSRGETRRQRN